MPPWGIPLTIITLLLGLALTAIVFRIVWLLCQEREPSERNPGKTEEITHD